MELKQIDAGIKTVARALTKTFASVQTLGVAIIEHAKAHGDCTRALALVKAVGTGANQRKLIQWFAFYGNIGMDVGGDKVRLIKEGSKSYRGFDIDGAKANPWNTFEDPRQPAEQLPITLGEWGADTLKFLDRLNKQVEDDKKFVNNPRQRAEAHAAIREMKEVVLKHIPNQAAGGTTDAEQQAAANGNSAGESRRGRQRKAA